MYNSNINYDSLNQGDDFFEGNKISHRSCIENTLNFFRFKKDKLNNTTISHLEKCKKCRGYITHFFKKNKQPDRSNTLNTVIIVFIILFIFLVFISLIINILVKLRNY